MIFTRIKGRYFCPFFIALLFAACSEPAEWKELNGEALGTNYHIQYRSENGRTFAQAEMDSIIHWMNHALSTYQDTSLISAFNANSNAIWEDSTQLPYFLSDLEHFINMVKISFAVSEVTDNAFDPTAALIFDAWAEAKARDTVVPDSTIARLLRSSGWSNMRINQHGVPEKRDSALRVNFNAVAKGYVVDEVADYLLEKGIDRFLVEIGGEVRVSGSNPDDGQWTLGVNTPDTASALSSVFEAIPLQDGAMATSGNYRNYYTHRGAFLGHTIDPRTGRPVTNALRSATVMHPYCAIADAYATACMVLGPDSAAQVIAADSSLTAYFIVEEQGELRGYFVE